MGHGVEQTALEPDESYAPAFRTLWQAGAASIPAETPKQLALLEPLTRWLVGRGRSLQARELGEALGVLTSLRTVAHPATLLVRRRADARRSP